MPWARASARVTLEAKVGIRRDRLVVEGAEYPLRREGGGWITVPAVGPRIGGRVRYDAMRDRIRIEGPSGAATIPFHWRHTRFGFRGRTYRFGPMTWGHIMVSRDVHPVITGRVTLSGVRFGFVADALEPIAHELAVGLAYRAVTLWVMASAAGAGGR